MSLDHDLQTGQGRYETQRRCAGLHLLDSGHGECETHDQTAAVDPLQTGQGSHETHRRRAGLHLLDSGHGAHETQSPLAAVDPLQTGQNRRETQGAFAGLHLLDSGQRESETQCRLAAVDHSGWVELRIAADLFDRAQQERIAVTNIIRRPEDGGNIDPVFFAAHLARLEDTEHQARLMLRRTFRRVVPADLRAWQKASRGIGEDLLARLLGHLGDPYIATPHYWQGSGSARTLMVEAPRVRTIGQLWQYAGHGDPHRRKTRGMTAEEAFSLGSPKVKSLVHLNAEACMKQPNGAHYRDLYVGARARVLDKTHSVECVRCGPSGKPAAIGTPWSPGHQHAHALRIVGKEILRDMWLARHGAVAS